MKHQLVIVKTPNKMLFIKGRLVRSPLEAIVKHQNELDLLVASLIHQGVEYEMKDYIKEKIVKKEIVKNLKVKKTKVKEEKEPITILENIVAEIIE